MIEKLYTVEEVAELASVTGRTIRNYLKSGRLVGRKIGGQWRFPESEVQRLLNGGEPDLEAAEPVPAPPATPAQPVEAPAVYAPAQEPAPPVYIPPAAPRPAPTRQEAPPVEYYPVQEPYQPEPVAQPVYAPQQSPAPQQAPTQPVITYPGYTAPAPLPTAVPPSPTQQQPYPYIQPAHVPQPLYEPTSGSEPAPPPDYMPQTPVYHEHVLQVPPKKAEPKPPAEAEPAPAPVEEPVPQPEPEIAMATQPDGAPAPELCPDILSDVSLKVLEYAAQVHDCSAGPQTCSIVELNQGLDAAKATSEHLAEMAKQESEGGIPCECYVEYDERYFIARYTLFGSTNFLMRCLQLIG